MSYVWRCKCGEDYPSDGKGFVQMRDHVANVHEASPGEWVIGIVEYESGDIMHPGYGPMVLKKARENGWAAQKGASAPAPGEDPIEPGSGGEVVPIASARAGRRQPTGRQASATMTVLAKNVVVDEVVQLLFHQASAEYDYDNTPQDFSRFVTEACVYFAMELNLQGGTMFAQTLGRVSQSLVEGGEDDGGDD